MNRPPISNQTRLGCAAASILVTAGIAVSITTGVFAQKADPAPGTPEFYTQKVAPILDDNCYSCHAEGQSGGLRLDSYKDMLHGGGHGSPIVPGDPDTSLLIQAIRRTGKLKMPPKHPLEQAEIDTLTAWVKAGAKGTDAPAETLTKSDAPATPVPTVTSAQPALTKVAVVTTPHAVGAMSDADFFENNVRPIIANNCSGCHVEATSGGLKLDSRESLLKGGEHGPALVPGDPDKSLIITAVHQTTKLKMPKGGKLNPQEVADLTEWVKRGAVWP
jgi:mono/diheme cytochrome c family protein